MDQPSQSANWARKHKLGFLVRMWEQQEPLVLERGGYWILPSLKNWYTDVDFVSEADKKGYLEKLRPIPDDCLDGRVLTLKGQEFAKSLVREAPRVSTSRSRRPSSVSPSIQFAQPKPISRVSVVTEAVRPPALTPKAIEVVNRLEKLLIEEPNCFTLRACCEVVPEFKTVAYPEKYPQSGVIGCLAGLTCLCLALMRGENSATFINNPHSELSTVAGAGLGLTDAQADRLFAHWSFDFLQSYRDARSAADRAKVAIGRIRRFIESGE